jgi:hypothetical protein
MPFAALRQISVPFLRFYSGPVTREQQLGTRNGPIVQADITDTFSVVEYRWCQAD